MLGNTLLLISCLSVVSVVLGQQRTRLRASQIESEDDGNGLRSSLDPQSQVNYNQYQPAAQQRRPIYISSRDPAYTYRPYSFDYTAVGEDGSSSRQESADGTGRVVGSYTLQVEDGRQRVVEYIADQDGFRATINTNEPGTDVQNPADVVFFTTARSNQQGGYTPTNTYRPRPVSRQGTSYRQRPAVIYSQPNVLRPVYSRPDDRYDTNAHQGQASSNYYYNDKWYHLQ